MVGSVTMSRSRVQSLVYWLEITSPSIRFADPPPAIWTTDHFNAGLVGDVLTVEPTEHHDSVDAARDSVDPYVRSYEVWFGLEIGHDCVRFHFVRGLLEESSEHGNPATHHRSAFTRIPFQSQVGVVVTKNQYPDPPHQFVADPLTTALWQRHALMRSGREPLMANAYAILTLIEGGNRMASDRLGVSANVLSKLRELSSTRGDVLTARKPGNARNSPLTQQEEAWIHALLPMLIRRSGAVASNPAAAAPLITLADLPPL